MTHNVRSAALGAAVLATSACTTTRGGGPLGFVLFDPKQHVAAAEPLFGAGDDKCLDDPTFLLTTFAQGDPRAAQPYNTKNPDICTRMKWALYWGLTSHGGSLTSYNKTARNEVLGSILAASDRKCGNYVAYLQQYNGNVKAGFGIINQIASALATVASGGLNRAFTTTAVISGHTRSELEEAHFANQALGILTHAFRVLRNTQRTQLDSNLQQMDVDHYTVSQGLADAFNYHASCSIVVGLEETQKAVADKEKTSDPGNDNNGITKDASKPPKTTTTTTVTTTTAGATTTTGTDGAAAGAAGTGTPAAGTTIPPAPPPPPVNPGPG